MEFEWDAAKDSANQRKHGIDFDEAKHIFDGPVLTRVDDRMDYGEDRHISLGGLSPNGVLIVVHTEKTHRNRLTPRANCRERKVYDDELAQALEGD